MCCDVYGEGCLGRDKGWFFLIGLRDSGFLLSVWLDGLLEGGDRGFLILWLGCELRARERW